MFPPIPLKCPHRRPDDGWTGKCGAGILRQITHLLLLLERSSESLGQHTLRRWRIIRLSARVAGGVETQSGRGVFCSVVARQSCVRLHFAFYVRRRLRRLRLAPSTSANACVASAAHGRGIMLTALRSSTRAQSVSARRATTCGERTIYVRTGPRCGIR